MIIMPNQIIENIQAVKSPNLILHSIKSINSVQ